MNNNIDLVTIGFFTFMLGFGAFAYMLIKNRVNSKF